MENRIKEQPLCLFADRTSSAIFSANHLRLRFSGVAILKVLHWDREDGLVAVGNGVLNIRRAIPDENRELLEHVG